MSQRRRAESVLKAGVTRGTSAKTEVCTRKKGEKKGSRKRGSKDIETTRLYEGRQEEDLIRDACRRTICSRAEERAALRNRLVDTSRAIGDVKKRNHADHEQRGRGAEKRGE